MRVFLMLAGSVGLAWGAPALVHPGEAFDAERTVIWTPLFQAAWDRMNANLGGPPEQSGSALMKSLDIFEWNAASVMPGDSWEAWAGPSTDPQLVKARQRVAELLGEEVDALPGFEPAPASILAFGGMVAEVGFEKELLGSEGRTMSFVDRRGREHLVGFFGVEQAKAEDYRRHIRVLAWRPKAGFMALELRGRDASTGSVILFQPPEPQLFSEACRWIREWRSHWALLAGGNRGEHTDRLLHLRDQVRVPTLGLVSDERLADRLAGSRVYPGKPLPYRVANAWQRVDFEMDERGARVKAATALELQPFGSANDPATVPRDFSFDEPFFVFLWRDGAAWPYFGAWIGDVSGMTQVP